MQETATEQLNFIENWLQTTGASIVEFLIKAAFCILIYIIVYKVSKRFCKWLSGRMEKHNLDRSMSSFVVALLRYGILIFTVVTMIVQLNIVAASSIAAVIASAGVAASLALQGGLSNFAGGIMLLILKPFKSGDYIIVNAAGLEGTVEKLEIYYTTIVSYDNKVHLVPNSSLTGNTITNVTKLEKRMLEGSVGISYNADLKKALSVLRKIMQNQEGILEKDDMQIYVEKLADSSVSLGYRVWVKPLEYKLMEWKLNENIKLTFDAEGIEIPYNQIDVHINN